MTADMIIENLVEATRRIKAVFPGARLRYFDDKIEPSVSKLVNWERLDAHDASRVAAAVNEARTRLANVVEHAKIERGQFKGGKFTRRRDIFEELADDDR